MAAWYMGALINSAPVQSATCVVFVIDALATPTVLSSDKGAAAAGMRITHEAAMHHHLLMMRQPQQLARDSYNASVMATLLRTLAAGAGCAKQRSSAAG